MNDPALGCWHGLQGDGPTGAGNLVSYPHGQLSQRVVSPLTVPLYIQHDPHRLLAQVLSHHQVDQELEGPQALTSTSNKKTSILSCNVYKRTPAVRGLWRF